MIVVGEPAAHDVAGAITRRLTVELSKCYVLPGVYGGGVAHELMAQTVALGRSTRRTVLAKSAVSGSRSAANISAANMRTTTSSSECWADVASPGGDARVQDKDLAVAGLLARRGIRM